MCEVGEGAHQVGKTLTHLFIYYHHPARQLVATLSVYRAECAREVERKPVTFSESKGKNHLHSHQLATSEILLNPFEVMSGKKGRGN